MAKKSEAEAVNKSQAVREAVEKLGTDARASAYQTLVAARTSVRKSVL
jgi:hypothetical protein